MQPYIFPYFGYFQLIGAVDTFILLDDVHYINRGWINRNRLLMNGHIIPFTIPLRKASQNKLINDIEICYETRWQRKFLKTLEQSYRKAPYFSAVFPLVQQVITANETHISRLVYQSLLVLLKYLEIDIKLIASSASYATEQLRAQDKILAICRQEHATHYINPAGGAQLYERRVFEANHVHISFLKPTLPPYSHFSPSYVPGLSILDVLMHNSPEMVKAMLKEYQLE